MDCGDEEDCDFDNDFIRRPKFYHSTPRLSSILKDNHRCKLSLTASSCENISPVDRAPVEYYNPFTPDGKVIATKANAQKKFKRLCISQPPPVSLDSTNSDCSKSDCDSTDIPRRPRLKEMNVSRLHEEFIVLEEIGKGVHGCVFKCLNRMNGCIYAIKKTLHPIKTDFQEKIVRNEIYAHGILIHPNVVCNFSSWIEEDFGFIQNEYCDLGNLEEYIKGNKLSENLLRSLLLQMAQALAYIHSKGLAHMDIKPANIFLKSVSCVNDDSGVGERSDDITFKLGDFGHVTSLDEDSDIEEGDCRYIPRELLDRNPTHLDRSDIYSLGLTVYEAAGGGPLPKNGEEWQEIRNGKLKTLGHLSREFNNIIKTMINPRPQNRPSALELVKMLKLSQSLSSHADDDLQYYYQHHYHNNSRLEHRVEADGYFIRELFKSHRQLHSHLYSGVDSSGYYSRELSPSNGGKRSGATESRLVGKKAKRSNSTMF
ncbi:wee1-like protein kinase [Macrosteles quadrilineatus]|uniref:wee1-like protein kinase n=1 Tax=Macrosteles quadrilineatus TaxID=74068 RepID=UPI0023E0BA64|nr:wee1-like protein kinase [Macrosteles quadrilineatus]